jgi:predicted esterase
MKRLFLAAAFLIILAGSSRADDLRAIADRYADDGDAEAARAALDNAKATPEALLAALRAPRELAPGYKAGEQKTALTDDHDTKTDLFSLLPPEEEVKAAAKDGGLTCMVVLHGLGGNGKQFLSLAKRLAPKERCVILSPTAQKLPQGLENDDVPIFDIGVPHWWAYKTPRSFPLEALRQARRSLPIDPDKVVLLGYSMGGFGTWNIGLRYPDRFAGIAPCAGGLSRREMFVEKDVVAREILPNARYLNPWFTHGDADSTVPVALDRRLHAALDSLEIPHTYEEVKGGSHILPLATGGGNADNLARYIATRHRNPAPETLEYVSQGEWQDGAYWLRVGRRAKKDGTITLRGAVNKAQNAVAIEVEGPAQAVDVYLDERLLDLSKPVTLSVKGQSPRTITATPDLGAILDSWRSREDPKLVYQARVRVELRKIFR